MTTIFVGICLAVDAQNNDKIYALDFDHLDNAIDYVNNGCEQVPGEVIYDSYVVRYIFDDQNNMLSSVQVYH